MVRCSFTHPSLLSRPDQLSRHFKPRQLYLTTIMYKAVVFLLLVATLSMSAQAIAFGGFGGYGGFGGFGGLGGFGGFGGFPFGFGGFGPFGFGRGFGFGLGFGGFPGLFGGGFGFGKGFY